jgi:multiple sugar transport system substrate-binding protein
MNVKRVLWYLVLALTAVFLAFSVIGCTGDDDAATDDSAVVATDDQVVLTFWTHIDNVWQEQQKQIIADFEADNPDIKIQLEAFPYDDFEAKTQTSLISHEGGADIYSLWGGWAVDYASTGAFAPVPADFVAEMKTDSYEPVLGAFEYDGNYYGVPLEFNNEYGGMLVDTPKFQELGIDYPATWEEMIEIARDNTVMRGTTFEYRGFDFPAWDALTYTWISMILSSGGQYMDGDDFNFDTPIGVETMQTLADYIKVDKITNIDGITNAEEQEPYQWFYLGESMMVPRGPWVVPEGEAEYDLVYGEDFEFVSMPFYGSEPKFAAETGWGLAVNANSKNQEAAWKFIEFWSEKERLLEYNIATGMIPPYKSLAHDPRFVEALPYMAPIVEILDGGQFIGYFNTDVLKEGVANMFVDIIENGTPVATAVHDLDASLNADR